jgi:hypothetical protein
MSQVKDKFLTWDMGLGTWDSFLDRLSSGEASLYVVPPFDLVAFAQEPAEQDDAPVSE